MSVGKIYFAMVDDEDFDPIIHAREDLHVFDLKISQSEGEFAKAALEILNPNIGFLDPSRKKRIYISCDVGDLHPKLLFSGRIIAYPSDLSSEFVTIEYLAQPNDWVDVQDDFIQTLKVSPYYNELFIAPEERNEPHEVLSSYSSLIYWDRSSNEIKLSDFIQGESVIDIGENIFFDTLSTSFGDPPINRILLNIEAQWRQIGVGEVDVEKGIRETFENSSIPSPQINTLTPNTFENGWRRIRIPKGYTAIENDLIAVANNFGLTQSNLKSGIATVDGNVYKTSQSIPINAPRTCSVPRIWYAARLKLLAEYLQKRRENVVLELNCSTQDYTLGEDVVEELSLRIQDPVSSINGAVLDPRKSSFFLNDDFTIFTDYGKDAIEYGLLRARARLIKGARSVEVSFDCPIDDVIDITCDHTIKFSDDRSPGTDTFGKVVNYSLSFNGDSGNQIASVTISPTIGTGIDSENTIGGEELEEVFYPTYDSMSDMASAVYYKLGSQDIDEPVNVDQMETNDQYLIDSINTENDGEAQNAGFVASTTPEIYLEEHKTRIEVNLKSMNPSPELSATIEVLAETFTLPAQINLGDLP